MTTPARLLGMFAHPDDEVFCIGGSLAKYAAAGVHAEIVSATRGEAGQIRDAAVATRRTLGACREAELAAAGRALGIAGTRCLDYLDGTLASIEGGKLVDDIVEVIRQSRPDVVVTFGADGAYGHPDHVTVSNATTEAVQALVAAEDPAAPQRLYHSHFPRSRLLLTERLAGWLIRLAEQSGRSERFQGRGSFAQALTLFAEESTALRYASDSVDVQWFPPGMCVVEQGEAARSLYLILSGTVDISEEGPDGQPVHLRTQGAGQFFGEIGVAGSGVRTATVVASEPLTCLVLSMDEMTLYAGRGADAVLYGTREINATDGASTVVDVSDFVDQKWAAILAHRSQFPMDHDVVPHDLLVDMLGREYFLRVHPPFPPEPDLMP